ncbi:MAG: methylmalonate-semialdehyde dehydrogenase (acylating) [Gammaproteobacteria bacterium RIFCSPHIGHO2_12_FULL_37_14]|nr:MAG: methylmalonate-semialdehyde dehydrogenase (acylating) [Gammaproteobacteria bacterium RIFCSPHIGHO2_12_FULL_37_14]
MTYDVPHIVNGQSQSQASRKLDVYDPVAGQVAGYVSVADSNMVQQAIAAAKQAFTSWSCTTAPQRAKILFRFKTLLDKNLDELAKLVTQEHGKTLVEAIGSVQRGIDVVDFTCGIPHHLQGMFTDNVSVGIDCYSLHQPVGVCVGITPFNFPAMIPLWMFPMAIACGNTFVLKPSEKDPSCSVRLVELAKEAGVPDGVVNIVHGDKETVDALLMHPDIQAISFVGSSAVAEYVYRTGITHNKRVQAFGGAKNHCIVMPDADVNQAAEQLIAAAFGSAGERCMAISIVLTIGDDTADKLISIMQAKIKNLKIGSGLSTDTDMGPLITQAHWERVQSYIALGKQEGAKLVIDGSHYKPKSCSDGFFMGACLFDHVTPNMRIYKEEIFGPVLGIVRVANFDQALQLINAHEYGNGTAIFTSSGYIARTFAEKVQVGMVGINLPVPVPVAYHSFGGWKRSIFSDIGMYGTEAIRFYTKLKTVTQRWLPRISS